MRQEIRYRDIQKLRNVIEAKWSSHVPELDLAINTGIRKGSQYGLTWDMVDWKGRMLEDIADLLGHKSSTMTRRYAHLGPNKLHAVVSLLGASATTSATSENGVTATTSQVAVH
jgi:hypothetical protein